MKHNQKKWIFRSREAIIRQKQKTYRKRRETTGTGVTSRVIVVCPCNLQLMAVFADQAGA